MKRAFAAALLLASCHRAGPRSDTPGSRLEAAAQAAGMIVDPAAATLTGTWARDTDRLCAVPRRDGAFRIGLSVDYGPGQQCAGRGIATRRGEQVRISIAGCTVDARFEGDALIFPPIVPSACDSLCSGRASLAAMRVERLGESVSEATMMRAPGGALLCDD